MDHEMDAISLAAYLIRKYPDRAHADDLVSISLLAAELQDLGYARIEQLDIALQRSARAFEAYEKAHPPFVPEGQAPRFNSVGVVITSLCITDPTCIDYWLPELSEESRKEFEEYRHLLS